MGSSLNTKVEFILLQPVMPRRHQPQGLLAAAFQQVEHPPGPAPARTALGIAADGTLLIEKGERLLQHGLGEAQLGMGRGQVVHQGRGISVGLQQALQHPAHRQLQPQVLNGGPGEKGMNGLQAGAGGLTGGSDHGISGRALSTN